MKMKVKALKAAIPYTIPIFTGFIFLGISYGFIMTSKGFSFLYPILMSLFICAGSMQFVAVNLLLSSFNPMYALLLTLMVNARHIFYGISMLDSYNKTGRKKWYLIYALCDETFSINCTISPPEHVDKNWFMFFITLLNHSYWIIGTAIGGILGSVIELNTKGIDFALTALFVVIFLDQWNEAKNHRPAIAGLGAAIICILVFGKDNFMIPTMLTIFLFFFIDFRVSERSERTI